MTRPHLPRSGARLRFAALLLVALVCLAACRDTPRSDEYYRAPLWPHERPAARVLPEPAARAGLAEADTVAPPAAPARGDDALPARAPFDGPPEAALPAPQSHGGALPDFARLYRRLEPSVVNLYARVVEQAPRRGRRIGDSVGSGVILTADGEVLTNYHVVENAVEVTVRLHDGRRFTADVVGIDPPTDLALLRLRGLNEPLQPAVLGDSDALAVGDWVAAIGNPMGLEHTLTRGIVSAKGRRALDGDPMGYSEFLQVDAAVNPGNSGGPLFNLAGEVVGINTGISRQGRGIAFALPARLVARVVERLRVTGVIERAWIGLAVQPLADDSPGARVRAVVSGSPAERAGLRVGDEILALDGARIDTPFDLRWQVAMARVGERIVVTVRRAGEVFDLGVWLVLAEVMR
jgi:serine protease Do